MVTPTLIAVSISTGSSVALAVMQKQLRNRRDEQILGRMEEIQCREATNASDRRFEIENKSGIPKSGTLSTSRKHPLRQTEVFLVDLENEWIDEDERRDNCSGRLRSIVSGLGAIELVGDPRPYRGTHHQMVEQAADGFKRLTGGINELVDHIGWEGGRPDLVAGHIPDISVSNAIVEVESNRGLTDSHTWEQMTALASSSVMLILAVPEESRAEAERLFGDIATVTSTPWESTAVSGLQGFIPYLSTKAAGVHPWILNVIGIVELYQFLHTENSQDEQRLLALAEENDLEELAMLAILELDAEKQAQRASLTDRITEMLPFGDRDESVEIEVVQDGHFESHACTEIVE